MKIGDCTLCPKKDTYIVKSLPEQKLCYQCNKTRLAAKKKPKKPIAKKTFKDATGELILFKELATKRPHVSAVSGQYIPNISIWNMSHLVSKGASKALRLNADNIVFMTVKEHIDYHNKAQSDLIRENPNWVKIFELRDLIKRNQTLKEKL